MLVRIYVCMYVYILVVTDSGLNTFLQESPDACASCLKASTSIVQCDWICQWEWPNIHDPFSVAIDVRIKESMVVGHMPHSLT